MDLKNFIETINISKMESGNYGMFPFQLVLNCSDGGD